MVRCVGFSYTCDGLLVVLDSSSPLHLHHAPLDAAVADVAEFLRGPLDPLGHRIRGGGSEASLTFLKVFMVFYLNKSNPQPWLG